MDFGGEWFNPFISMALLIFECYISFVLLLRYIFVTIFKKTFSIFGPNKKAPNMPYSVPFLFNYINLLDIH